MLHVRLDIDGAQDGFLIKLMHSFNANGLS